MSGEPNTLEWIASGTGLIAIGGGAKWLLEWWSKRDERREAREAQREGAETEKVSKLNARVEALEDKLARLTIAVNILVAKEYRTDPSSPEMEQVRAILGDAFPLHLRVPPDMTATLDKL